MFFCSFSSWFFPIVGQTLAESLCPMYACQSSSTTVNRIQSPDFDLSRTSFGHQQSLHFFILKTKKQSLSPLVCLFLCPEINKVWSTAHGPTSKQTKTTHCSKGPTLFEISWIHSHSLASSSTTKAEICDSETVSFLPLLPLLFLIAVLDCNQGQQRHRALVRRPLKAVDKRDKCRLRCCD